MRTRKQLRALTHAQIQKESQVRRNELQRRGRASLVLQAACDADDDAPYPTNALESTLHAELEAIAIETGAEGTHAFTQHSNPADIYEWVSNCIKSFGARQRQHGYQLWQEKTPLCNDRVRLLLNANNPSLSCEIFRSIRTLEALLGGHA